MIDYVSGGACACCGLKHLFLPNGISGLIQAVSDLETDQAKNAMEERSPWPEELKSQVWADRVKLRQKLKLNMSHYQDFWNRQGDSFEQWFLQQPKDQMKRTFQLPRREIMEMVREKYNIHSSFGVLLCGILEQVAHYQLTAYPVDGRGAAETRFETYLKFSRQGGFTLDFEQKDWQQVWLERMRTLGGPKLLQRGNNSIENDTNSEEQATGADEVEQTSNQAKSNAGFASDRRIARLLIARYWADSLQERFLEVQMGES